MKYFLIIVLSAFAPVLYGQMPLSLNNAVELALKNNYDIRVSRNESAIYRANNTSGNAGMLPTIDLSGGVDAAFNTTRAEAAGGTVTNTTPVITTVDAGISLDWTLFDGGKMFVTRQRLRQVQQMGELSYRETVQATLYEVIAAYYDLVRLQQQLKAICQTLRYNQERVMIAQTGFDNGTLAKPDLLQAKIDLNEVQEAIIDQNFAIREGMRTLNVLLNRDSEVLFKVKDSIPEAFVPDRNLLFNRLNANNASLLSFQKQVEINRLAFKETKSNYLPQFNIGAGYYLTHTQNKVSSVQTMTRSIGPQVSGTLSVPLFHAGENKRLQKVAELNLRIAEINLEQLKIQMNTELQNALNDFDNQNALINIEEENNKLAVEYLEISIQRLKFGQTTSLEVHLAQEQFMNSNARLINYRYGLKLAETKLRQLVAGLTN
jgi:outer membrane protein